MNEPVSTATSAGTAASHAAAPRSFVQRVVAVLKLDASVYEEVEHDPGALGQAALVVILASFASALAALGIVGVRGVIGGLVLSAIIWLLWTSLVWLIGVKILDHSSDFEELLRTLGFVAAPQLLNVLQVIPVGFVQVLVTLAVAVLTTIAFVQAVRQALDVDTGRALGVALLAVFTYLLVGWLFSGALWLA